MDEGLTTEARFHVRMPLIQYADINKGSLMKIHSVTHDVPELVINNDEAIALFRERNNERFTTPQLDLLEQRIRQGLKVAGIERRHITPPGQPVHHLLLNAARRSLDEAGFSAADIDLVIYVGIGRGWLEPAMSSWVQYELGLHNATGFDVLDACASWLRGLEVAQAFLEQGHYKTILLVNSEAGMSVFADLAISDEEMLAKTFAIFTVGEAATATVLTNQRPDRIHFKFRTFPRGFNLCLIPLENAVCYSPEMGNLGSGRFYAASDRLVSATIRRIVETYRNDDVVNQGEYDILFSHSASAKAIGIITSQLGLPIEKYVGTHTEFGNTSSASIPLGMSLAIEDGRLKRGDSVLAVAGSAGITVGFASFTY